MTAESPKYSRSEISDESKRKSTAEEIKTANKGADKKKTPEGKKELSQTWIQKANLTPALKQVLCDELLVKDIDAEDPKELERRAIALQKHLGFPEKDCDGILGWKTLEKVDQMVENQHKIEDEEGGIQNNEDGYGFDRVVNEETKEKDLATRKEKLGDLKRQAESTDTADHEGDIRDPEGKSLTYDVDKKQWVGNESDTSGKIFNTETGKYETLKERESLKTEQLLTSIKGAAEAGDSRDYIDGYVKELPADSLSTEQMKDLNNTLNPKGYNVVDATHGYTLEDYDSGVILASSDINDSLTNLSKLGEYKYGETPISQMTLGAIANIDGTAYWGNNTTDGTAINSALVQIGPALAKYPELRYMKLSDYQKYKDDSDGFMLDPNTRKTKSVQMMASSVGGTMGGSPGQWQDLQIDTYKDLGIGKPGVKYSKMGDILVKNDGEETAIASGNKFVSFENYLTENIEKTTDKPTPVPGSLDKYYMLTFSPTGEKQITIGKKGEGGGIEQKGARYFANGEWKDSNVS